MSVRIVLFMLPWVLLLAGCGSEKLQEVVNTVKDQAKAVTETSALAEVLPETGKAEIGLPTPLSTSNAYARLYNVGDGRPAVVQFTTYEPDKGPNEFPALLIRATTPATSLDALAGQTLNARVFLQPSAALPVLSTPEPASVAVSVGAVNSERQTIAVSISGVTLFDPLGQPAEVSGISVEAVLP